MLSASYATFMPTAADAQNSRYIGDVMAVGFNFCPRGWIEAKGQLLPISENSALFSLYGTTYGGDGRSTFGIPEVRGRALIGFGQSVGLANYKWGGRSGAESFTAKVHNMPVHNHSGGTHTHARPDHGHTAALRAGASAATVESADGDSLATFPSGTFPYAVGQADGKNLSSDSVTLGEQPSSVSPDQSTNVTANTCNGAAKSFRDPYIAVLHCVCLTDCIYPSRS